jgi:hypothetical protein
VKYPKSESMSTVKGPDGRDYRLAFYGENEGAAVVCGPVPPSTGRLYETPEVHREPAADADDARTKLAAWLHTAGWTT